MERLKSVECFDSRTNLWSEMPPLTQRRSALCVGVLGDQMIYACGGYDGTSALAAVESFDLALNRWILRPPMLSSRCAAAAAVVNGVLYGEQKFFTF